MNLPEVQIFGTTDPSINLALGSNASSFSVLDANLVPLTQDFSPNAAIDGNIREVNTDGLYVMWQSTANDTEPWLRIDLPQDTAI